MTESDPVIQHSLQVAAAQFESVNFRIDLNLKTAERCVIKAKNSGAELLL